MLRLALEVEQVDEKPLKEPRLSPCLIFNVFNYALETDIFYDNILVLSRCDVLERPDGIVGLL